MNDAQYAQLAEETFAAIEESIDESGAALDYENAGGILTVYCDDSDSQIVISRQEPLKQIWVAAKSGGFHLSYTGDHWVCTTTDETLQVLLSRTCSEQSDSEVALAW